MMYKIIGADLKEYGPVSAEQLRQWVTEGRVNGQTKVAPAEGTDWRLMSELPEFAGLFPAAPAPVLIPAAVPIAPLPVQPRASQMAVWSMVTGIVSILCCCGWFVFAPLGIVLGAVALSQMKSQPALTGRGFAILGIVLGIVAILIWGATDIFFFLNPDALQNLQSQLPH
ncbi:MAG TPA: DUF4190 domain-containing protein [Verrucomicrobiae bacterium]|jgi:hypothetical protein